MLETDVIEFEMLNISTWKKMVENSEKLDKNLLREMDLEREYQRHLQDCG